MSVLMDAFDLWVENNVEIWAMLLFLVILTGVVVGHLMDRRRHVD